MASKKILVVEDDPNSRRLLEDALSSAGYEVLSASDGKAGLKAARSTIPDLIISDLLMPQMDGYELCQEIKQDPKLRNIPFLVYTATYVEREDEILARAMGADDFLVKPAEIPELLKTIDDLLTHTANSPPSFSSSELDPPHEIDRAHIRRLVAKLDKKVMELSQERDALKASQERYRRLFDTAAAALREEDLRALWDWFHDFASSVQGSLVESLQQYFEGNGAEFSEAIHRSSLLAANLAALEIYETNSVADLREAWNELVARTDGHEYRALIMALAEGRRFAETEANYRTADGSERRAFVRIEVPRDRDGFRRVLISALDVTDYLQAEETLRKLSRAVEQSPVSVIITDLNGTIQYVNPRFSTLTGYSADEAVGRTPRILKSERVSESTYASLWQAVSNGHTWEGELYNRRKDGEDYWEYLRVVPVVDNQGELTHFLSLGEDITTRKNIEATLVRQASHDALTGLPNRVLILDRLEQALSVATRNGEYVIVMFVDLDQFKTVNDTLGHPAGDAVLVDTGKRLRNALREGDSIARLGGDEFLVILPKAKGHMVAEVVADKILGALREPFVYGGHEFFLSASIGVSVGPSDGSDPFTLLRDADAAMYRAKDDGRNTYRFFTPTMNKQALRRLNLDRELRKALEREELELALQPIIDLCNGNVVACEALLRWNNAEFGEIRPDEFIPLAESTGLIVPLGEWVLDTACTWAAHWHENLTTPPRISVNISPRQLQDERFFRQVHRSLETTGLGPAALDLEVTEQLLLDDRPLVHRHLQDIGELGVGLSIDDFGTGYSAMSYLKRFRFTTLKIDRSFVCDHAGGNCNEALIQAIIAMGHAMQLQVIAEGVETEQQRRFLCDSGCDLAQGFLLSRPLPRSDFEQILNGSQSTNFG